jgi:PKD domain
MARTKTQTTDEPSVEAAVLDSPVAPEVLAGAAGGCGETPCWTRTAVTFTNTNVGRAYTFTPAWPGNIAWDFGDGSPVVVGRGPVTYTYGSAGSRTVKATPLASSCLKAGTKAITVA